MKIEENTTRSINNQEKNNDLNGGINMDALIENLKNEDASNLRKTKNLKWLYTVLVIFYTLLFVVNPDQELGMNSRIAGLCYVLSFTFFALVFRHYQRIYKEIDYSEPLLVLLKKAADRYKLSAKTFLILMPSVILIDIGLTFSFSEHLASWKLLERILLIQALFIPIMFISGFIGVLIWKGKQKPLRDEALEMLKELER